MSAEDYDERRITLAVYRRHGCWHVYVGDPTGNSTPDVEHDAASRLDVAKRIAVETALALGWSGSHRWEAYEGRKDAFDLVFTRGPEELEHDPLDSTGMYSIDHGGLS